MRILLLTMPGRGDTEPFIALGLRLRADGHSVLLAARPDVAELVAEHGLDFAPLGNPYQPFIAGAAKAGAMGSGHPLNKLRYGVKTRRYVTESLHRDAWEAGRGAQAIIYKWPWITGHTLAEKLAVPAIPVMLLPLVPTAAFPSFVLGRGIDRGSLLNRSLWTLPWQAIWSGLRHEDAKFRRQLGLGPLSLRAPTIGASSAGARPQWTNPGASMAGGLRLNGIVQTSRRGPRRTRPDVGAQRSALPGGSCAPGILDARPRRPSADSFPCPLRAHNSGHGWTIGGGCGH